MSRVITIPEYKYARNHAIKLMDSLEQQLFNLRQAREELIELEAADEEHAGRVSTYYSDLFRVGVGVVLPTRIYLFVRCFGDDDWNAEIGATYEKPDADRRYFILAEKPVSSVETITSAELAEVVLNILMTHRKSLVAFIEMM